MGDAAVPAHRLPFQAERVAEPVDHMVGISAAQARNDGGAGHLILRFSPANLATQLLVKLMAKDAAGRTGPLLGVAQWPKDLEAWSQFRSKPVAACSIGFALILCPGQTVRGYGLRRPGEIGRQLRFLLVRRSRPESAGPTSFFAKVTCAAALQHS